MIELMYFPTINESHKKELYLAAQDESIWAYNGSKAFGEQFYSWFDKAIKSFQEQQQLPFIVRRLSDEKVIGSTRYYEIKPEHHRLTIGYTWYTPSYDFR